MLHGMSLIYNWNRQGPSSEPCGTPDVTGTSEEISPPIMTHWDMSVFQEEN